VIVKRPDNLFHKATIPTGLPKVKFVIIERDWRDTSVSIFGTRLHLQHGYATNAVAIAEHIRLCHEIAGFWYENHPKSVYRISYKALVNDPKSS
jgi:hypothetical protein